MASGWYILGEEVERYEADWAAYCGAAHGIGVASGLGGDRPTARRLLRHR